MVVAPRKRSDIDSPRAFPATFASETFPHSITGRVESGRIAVPDLLGWNIYPGWYSDWGPITVNGVSKGFCPNDGNAVFVWKDVKLSPEENRIAVNAQRDGENVSDACVWTLKE